MSLRFIWSLVLLVFLAGCWRSGVNQIAPVDSATDSSPPQAAVASGVALEEGYQEVSLHKYEPGHDQIYYFGFDQYQLSDDDVRSLEIQAQYLKSHPNQIAWIAGNTSIEGSREYNMVLGEKRAKAAWDILRLLGVPKHQVKVVSFGKEKPVAPGNTERAHRLNRRVEFKYIKKGM